MSDVSIVTPDDGEVIELGPARMRVLEGGDTTGHRLGIGEITLAPHSDGPPQHRHALHDEGFYILSGTARFTVGEREYDATSGTLVMVPPGVPHSFANPGDQPLVMINTFTPDLYVQYFRDLRDVLATGGGPDERAEVMGRYATTVADDYA
jgi:mannose-6-phosphate isomerase-like protein (cupin superfamily)